MTTELEKRLRVARDNLRQQQEKTNRLAKEVRELQLAADKEEYNCCCVKLNRDIEIYDMQEQERRNRTVVSYQSFVPDCLSARRDCPDCKGAGKVKK